MKNWLKIGFSKDLGNCYACKKCGYNFTDDDAVKCGGECPRCGSRPDDEAAELNFMKPAAAE